MAAAVVAGCGVQRNAGGREAEVLVDTIPDGQIRVRHVGFALRTPDWVVREDLRLGSSLGDSPDVVSQAVDVLLAHDGGLYVLDQAAQEVRVFDSSGAFTGSFGGKGAGPGEFSQANGLSWSARTTIWVVDMGNGRYSEFSRDGQFLGSHQAQFSHREPVSVFAVGEGLIYDEWLARSAAGITLSARRLNLLTGLSDMLVLTDSIGTPAYRTRRGTYTVPFGWRFVWRPTDSGAAWFARTDEYAIHRRVFGSDTSLTIMTDLSPFPVTDADRSDAIAVIERMKQRFGDRDRFDYSRIPRKKPLIGNLDIDSRGRVWVRRVTKDTSVWLDVFGVDGRHVMSVQTPWFASPWHPVRVMGEFVACVVTDSLGVNYVVRGRLQRRPR